LKEARVAAGFTQKELARATDLGERTIGQYERGEARVSEKAEHSIRHALSKRLAERDGANLLSVITPAPGVFGSIALNEVPEEAMLAELLRRAAARNVSGSADTNTTVDEEVTETRPVAHLKTRNTVYDMSAAEIDSIEKRAATDDDTAPEEFTD
jgi:transcriptional regulator with XRE-family HTH domain